MNPGSAGSIDGEVPTANLEKAKLIESLLIGSGADIFREFEQRFSQFCPFEAIGMVRQEIRHAHFLSFILDPNRPHPFQDQILKAFLQEIAAQAQEGQVAIQPLTIHCSDFSNALVYREKSDIDIMIEVPPNSHSASGKGMVVTVELKVDAPESKHQLSKYYEQVLGDYPSDDWEHVFVFLTLYATAPSEANSQSWIPISMVDVIDRFDLEVQAQKYTGDAVDLYRNYSAMIRRHLVDDENMAQLAKSIWAKHKEALEALYEYWPDLQAEVIDWLSEHPEELAQAVKKSNGFTVVPDTSGARILRYAIHDWRDIPGFDEGDTNWVASGSLLVLELADWGDGRLRFSFVLGPGDPDAREEIYRTVLERVDAGHIKIGRRTPSLKNWKHLSVTDVQTVREYAKAEDNETSAEELGRKVVKKMVAFLESHLPVYDEVLRKALK